MADEITLTPEELAKIQEAAAGAGMTIQQFEAAAKAAGMTLDQFAVKLKGARVATSAFGSQLTESFGALNTIQDWISQTEEKLGNLGSLTGARAADFGLLSTAILGSTKRFEEFNTVMSGGAIGSFTESFKGMIETVRSSKALDITIGTGKRLYETLLSLGGPTDKLKEAVKGGGAGLAAYAEQLMTGADNSLKFQSGLIKAWAQSGALNDMMTKGAGTLGALGEGFENLNQVTSHYNNIMTQAMRATGIENVDLMAKFLNEVNKTPGAAADMAKGMDLAGTHTDALTGIIKIAHGAGLDVQQTFQDMRQAATEYGIGLNDSTRLIARYTDVQKSTGAQQEDVRNAIMKTLGAFKSYTMQGTDTVKMTNSLTDSVKNWANSLKEVGVPIQQAMEMGAKYTAQLKDMDEAQESFVSQTTGGEGGLAGSFDFEDLIRTGKTQEASAKVAEAMRQQLRAMGGSGEILSREQARNMGAAGKEQFERQRQMMMSGLLGIKPGSREEGEQMMAALAKGGDLFGAKATTKEEAAAAVDQTVQRGTALEQLAYTGVKEANITAEEVRLQGETINLGTLQNAMAARAGGIEATGRGIGVRGQETLRGVQAAGMNQAMGPGTAQAFTSAKGLAQHIPTEFTSMAQSIQRQLTQGKSLNEVLKDTGLLGAEKGSPQYDAERKMIMSGQIPGLQARTPQEADAIIDALNQNAPPAGGGEGAGGTGGTTGTALPGIGGTTAGAGAGGGKVLPGLQGATSMGPRAGGAAATATIQGIGGTSAANQVGRVIPGIGRGTEAAGATPGGRTIGGLGTPGGVTGPVPVSLASGASITVNLTGACPHCGRGIQQSQQSRMQSAPSTSSNNGVGP